MRAMPFRTASEASVDFEAPVLHLAGIRIEAGQVAPTWDYQTECLVTGSCTIDCGEFLHSTGLTDISSVGVTMQIDCPATGYRTTSAVAISNPDVPVQLVVTVPTNTVAAWIEVRYGLVLTQGLEERTSLAPFKRGSRVFTHPRTYRFVLEGDGANFPTEALDFNQAGLPSGAPWHFVTRAESLSDPFMGVVRLYINTAHPAADGLLSGEAGLTGSMLFHSILEHLILTVADREWDVDWEAGFEDGSLGQVMDGLTGTYLAMTLPQTIRAIRGDRDNVLTRLRGQTGLLREAN